MRILDLCVVIGVLIVQLLMIANILAYLVKQWYNWKINTDNCPNSPSNISASGYQKIHDVTDVTTTSDEGLNNLVIVMGDKSWKVIKKGNMNINGIDPKLD